jgi:eukaryotic translation initiation factor 2C
MKCIGNYRSIDEMYEHLRERDEPKFLDTVISLMKSAKIKTNHLGHLKKFKGFGPRCSNFVFDYIDTSGGAKRGTIAEYFESKYLIKLKYAAFPSINVGTEKKPQYVPVELISVVAGQSRQKECQNVTAQLIKYAAIKPNDRIKMLRDAFESNGVIGILQADKNSNAFGFTEESIESKPIKVETRLLPPPKLKYYNKEVEPQLKGSWDLKGLKFYKPGGSKDGIKVDIVCVGERIKEKVVESWFALLQSSASNLGLQLNLNTSNKRWLVVESERSTDKIDSSFESMIRDKVDIVFCILSGDTSSWYRIVKSFSDSRCLPSQCMKYSNIERTKPGFIENLLLKINIKTGGVNHTLASRQPSDLGKRSRDSGSDDHGYKPEDSAASKVFQDPPNSISWLFNEPCMLLGLDVNHPEVGSKDPRSVASLVGSMDGSLSAYASHVSTQSANCENHNFLSEATENLVKTFKRKNGFYPSRIICFRDGVADSQFKMLEGEILAIKEGLIACGFDIGVKDSKTCPIAMIVCQKRHNTRLFYRYH